MRITKINIAKTPTIKDGLEEITMDKLGDIVLIAGKNGSGKTRILNKINKNLAKHPTLAMMEETKNQIELKRRSIIIEREKLHLLQNIAPEKKNEKGSKIKRHYITGSEEKKQIESSIHDYRMQIKELENSLKDFSIQLANQSQNQHTALKFVPKTLHLKDSNEYNHKDLLKMASTIERAGVENLANGSLAKIQVIQNRWFNATHSISFVSVEEKNKAISDYEKLQNLIEVFLNTNIKRTKDGEATLFGFPMGSANMSDGQKVLLQFCLAIYSQETSLNDLILMLDEPENHLHPSVVIETIERIRKHNTKGQIWIATHSIPILAHFDPSSIWYVEDGKISHAGKIPEKVLEGLLGDESEIGKLQDFINLPAQYASARYAFESLIEPAVVMTAAGDPQSLQIRKNLLDLSKDGKLRILDFGAGQGRILSNLFDLEQGNLEELIAKLDYIAFDEYPTYKEQCEGAIAKVYEDTTNRYFDNIESLLSVYDKKSFNVVIMCNVLHEIDPKDWLKLFGKDGKVSNLLADNGILLLVEDQRIPTGEKAYQKGFLVMDTPHLKDLFKITEKDAGFTIDDARSDGRLKAHQIPKKCLTRISEKTRLAAIKALAVTAREQILAIRGKDKNYKNGKLHGFWTQQFANAQLNIAEFSSK